ncbi:MAG: hypothetical protein U0797_06790 [Gemmataceae bacterium]
MTILSDASSEGEARRDAAALTLLRRHRCALVRDLARAAVRLAAGVRRGHRRRHPRRRAHPARSPPGRRRGRRPRRGRRRRSSRASATARRGGPSHCRPLAVWQLADAAAALAWLAAHPPIVADPVPAADPHDYAI